jgi:hypothetical protein
VTVCFFDGLAMYASSYSMIINGTNGRTKSAC